MIAAFAHGTRVLALLALIAPLFLAESAAAQHREFAGRVVAIDAQSISVKGRLGDKVTFARGANTAVEGKGAWEEVAVDDKVLVRWKLSDGSALRVTVLQSGKHN